MAERPSRAERLLTPITALIAVMALGGAAKDFVLESSLPRLQPLERIQLAERNRPRDAALTLEHVRITPYTTAGGEVLLVRGWLRNDTAAPRPLPRLQASLLGAGAGAGQQAISAPLVARAAPEPCALADSMGPNGPALATLLASDARMPAVVAARSAREVFSMLPGVVRGARYGWVTLDWLP